MTVATERRNGASRKSETKEVRPIRCAIYTRKSTSEGLESEFTSLDAQREACENYIRSQQGQGWVCLNDQYDDGGYTGGNTDRPALQRLLADIKLGKLDVIVVYKIDRLSRSLMDFARLIELFEQHQVAIVSITQSLDTGSSMGRLTLNILLSFAQFERELISERTRDKMAAARRRGKWAGGKPPLGYDVVNSRLVVNELEADRIREIFCLYLDRKSLLEVVKELNHRGWTTKRWTTKGGKVKGGSKFDKNNLYYFLRNVLYIGKVSYQDEIYEGEHEGIVEPAVFELVQQQLMRHGKSGGLGTRVKNGGILSSLIRCHACECAMTHTYTARGSKRYRYYVCLYAQKRGYDTCPAPSVPAEELERFVVDQIRVIGRDSSLLATSLGEIARRAEEEAHHLNQEAKLLTGHIHAAYGELSQVSVRPGSEDRTAKIQTEIDKHQHRLAEIRRTLDSLSTTRIDRNDVKRVFSMFDPLWNAMSPLDQSHLLRLLIERIDYDGQSGEIELHLHPAGIRTLVDQHTNDGETP